MKKILYLPFFLLFSILLTDCGEYTDCSGYVGNRIKIALYDTKTKTLGKAYSYNISAVNDDGTFLHETDRFDKSLKNPEYYSKDSINYHYLEFDGTGFDKEKKFKSTIKVDGEEKCVLEFTLTADKRCNGYAEKGTLSIVSGNARFVGSTSPVNISGGNTPKIVIDK